MSPRLPLALRVAKVALMASLATALVYGIGGGLVIEGVFQLGTLVAIATLLTRLFGPITQLSGLQETAQTVVVSVEEKAHMMRQVGIGKASVSEPLLTCREVEMTSKPGRSAVVRDEPGGCPSIGQVVSGMKVARARSAASAWNVGRQTSTQPRSRAQVSGSW